MNRVLSNSGRLLLALALLTIIVLQTSNPLLAQSCSTGADLDAATKTAIDAAATRYLQMSKNGDVAGLKANAIPAIAGDFGSIEQAVVTNKDALADGNASIAGTYLLDASQAKAALPRAEFYCGIYNSPERISFAIRNLPPGQYGVVVQQVKGKNPITLGLILQNVAGAWKLAGYYPHPESIGGHDSQWYLNKAREYKAKGQMHNAWFYYLTAWDLDEPLNFMSTPQREKMVEEMQSARPSDLPSGNSPLTVTANGKSFSVTDIAAVPVDGNLDLRIRYTNANAANSGQAFQDNMAVIKAVVAKYPEVRDAFNSVIARAVDTSGHEYGSLLPVKDVK